MARGPDIKTPECRFAFTRDLFIPRANERGQKKHTGVFLFAKSIDLSELKNAAGKCAIDEWGEKAVQWIKDGLIKTPFLDGDGPQAINKKTGERHAGFAGTTFIRVMSGEEYKPKIVDRNRVPILTVDGCPSGWYGFAVVNPFTWDDPKNGKGVSFGVSALQVVREGESLGGGGGVDVDNFFEKLGDAEAPTKEQAAKGAGGLFD